MGEWPKTMVEATPVQCTVSTLKETTDELQVLRAMEGAGLIPWRLERVIPADLGRELYEALECFAAAHRQNQSGEYIEDVAAVTVADSRDPWKVAADVVARYEREVGK